jgi:hypothetical protein
MSIYTVFKFWYTVGVKCFTLSINHNQLYMWF